MSEGSVSLCLGYDAAITRGRLMVRYALAGLSLLLAAIEFSFGNPAGQTVTGRLAASLVYAFTPWLFALVFAGLKGVVQWTREKPTTFSSDLNWMWSVLLVIAAIAHGVAVPNY
jgi:hypothetical protein